MEAVMRSRTKHWIEVVMLLGAVSIAILMIAGYSYEGVARRHDRDRLPPQVGQSVDIGGRSMNIYCSGEGSPTVILESGGGGGGDGLVVGEARHGKFTTACWDDRAGGGWR